MAKQPTKDSPATVAALMGAIGVKRIVYVDDRFGITQPRVIALCNDLSVDALIASGVFEGVPLPTDDDAARSLMVTERIEGMNQEACEDAYRKLLPHKIPDGNHANDEAATSGFATLVANAATLERLSRALWIERRGAIAAELKEIPTLFVFDDDFTLEGEANDEGRRLIADLHVRVTELLAGDAERSKHAYALLTHNASTDEDELRLEGEISKDFAALKGFVVVMAKSKLASDEQRFIHRFKSTLLLRLFRVVQDKLAKATDQALDEARKSIAALSVDAFERIVFGSSQVEGAWSPETLARILSVAHERRVRGLLRADAVLHELVVEIDPLCRVAAGKPPEAIAKIARELQRSEIYDDGAKDLNPLHLPLELGDVFEQTARRKRYIVVAQPCDLVVRSDGFRRGKERDQRQLVALASIVTHQPAKDPTSKIEPHQHHLPYFEQEGPQYYAFLNGPLLVPAWLLDLAVLDEEGECMIRSGQVPSGLLPDSWRRRAVVLMDRAGQVVQLHDGAPSHQPDTARALLQALLRLPAGTPLEAALGPAGRAAGSDWTLSLGLKRVGRLRERYSTALLTHYGAWMARIAEPHDLAKFA